MQNLTVSSVDFSRLMPLVAASAARVTETVVHQLDEKLASATMVAPETMPPDVVTMNSKVLLSCSAWGAPREYRLVYPLERSSERGELSVLSVVGPELLGARDEILDARPVLLGEGGLGEEHRENE